MYCGKIYIQITKKPQKQKIQKKTKTQKNKNINKVLKKIEMQSSQEQFATLIR